MKFTNRYFVKRTIALGLSIMCIGNSFEKSSVKALLTRNALLEVYAQIEQIPVKIKSSVVTEDEETLKEVDHSAKTSAPPSQISKTALNEMQNINEGNIDWEYVKQLDLLKGIVYEKIGVLRNLRFFNGFIKKMTIKNNTRQYKYDSGVGVAEVMTTLFPSPTGNLATGNNLDFNPQLLAKLFGVLYTLREKNASLSVDIDGKIKKIITLANNNRTKETMFLLVNNVNSAKTVLIKKLEYFKEKEKSGKKLKDKELESKSQIQSVLEDNIDLYGKIDNMLNTTDSSGKKIIRPKKRKIFLKLIYDFSVMINEQEGTNETASNNKPLKQFTAERVLLGYCTRIFDSKEDIKNFYTALPEQIKLPDGKISTTTKNDALSDIKKLHDMLEKTSPQKNIPYDSALTSNNKTFQLEVEETSKCYFNKSKWFSDCVDTSIRHIVNLLTYNANDEKFHLPGSTCDVSKTDLDKILESYNSDKKFDHKSIKERLHIYYLYQNKQYANNSDELTRSLWNYVLSNISSRDNGMYDVVYIKEKNELSSGFVNVLKMCYNLAYALRDGKNCDNAKIAIDNIIKAINLKTPIEDFELKNMLYEALDKTLQLYNDEYKFNIDLKKVEKQEKNISVGKFITDIFGAVTITVSKNGMNLFNFSIEQQIGHGATKCDIQNQIQLDDKEKGLLENNDAALLYNTYNKSDFNIDDSFECYHKTAANKFVNKVHSFINYEENIRKWITENNVVMLISNVININFDTIRTIDILVDDQGTQIPLIDWTINSIFHDKRTWDYENIDLWYMLNIFSKDRTKYESFQKSHPQTVQKYNALLKILEKEKLDVSDLDILKKFTFEELSVNNPYESAINRILTSSNEIVESFIDRYIPQIYSSKTTGGVTTFVSKKLAELKRWDMLEKLLEKDYDFTRSGNLALILAKQQKFNILCKFRKKFNFNAYGSIDGITFEPAYILLKELIKDPNIKKELIHDVTRLVLKKDKITLSDLNGIEYDELTRTKENKLAKRCICDLSDEDFAKLIDRYQMLETNKRILLNIAIEYKQWGKVKKLLNMALDNSLFEIDVEAIFASGDKELIKILANKVKNVNLMINNHLASDYAYNVMHNKEIADIINPEHEIYQRIINKKNLESIPVYDDVTKYFEVHEGTTIAALAVQYLNDEDFNTFLQERLPIEKTRGKKLFGRMCTHDLSGFPINLIICAFQCSSQKFMNVIEHVPKEEINQNTFILFNDELKIRINILQFNCSLPDETKRKLQQLGIIS